MIKLKCPKLSNCLILARSFLVIATKKQKFPCNFQNPLLQEEYLYLCLYYRKNICNCFAQKSTKSNQVKRENIHCFRINAFRYVNMERCSEVFNCLSFILEEAFLIITPTKQFCMVLQILGSTYMDTLTDMKNF